MLGGSSQGEYDRGVNTFTPEGRILQIEYAINAINLGSTAVGVVTPHGVILGVERRLSSPLMDPESVEKMFKLDDHMGCAMSGLTCDARTLVDYAREKTTDHRFQFNEDATVASVTQFICDIVINFGESGKGSRRKKMSRPYGVALLVAGVDDQGPALFHTDPSGTFVQFKAKAVGSATDGAQDILDKGYHSNLTFEEGENLVVSTLKQVMEEKINKTNVELAVIPTSTRKWTLYDAEKVQAIMDRI